ncbi:restriction endonuclease [Aeromonas hydrophila]|nr:restriction endonuclease [Aeromonas hydrophila]
MDLIVDQVYVGGRNGNHSDEVLPKLLGVDNGAGFRVLGKPRTNVDTLRVLVLQTSFSELEWPDHLDRENGIFTYYGDKREPGLLHETKRDGNIILKNLFAFAHDPETPSGNFPIILLFGKTGTYRDTRFLGLAVPGAKGMTSDEDLTAVWRTTSEGIRFQNYRSIFTILDVPVISREWIRDAQNGNARTSKHAPKEWLEWVNNRKYTPLICEANKTIRTNKEQTDLTTEEMHIISYLHKRYGEKNNAYKFEFIAAEIVSLAMPNIRNITVTRPWRDGGRDAVGKYFIGSEASGIDVDFAMEAKCYAINHGVGVKETSRLISRLLHRQFGIFVTTSYVGHQAYSELIHDGHPVVVFCAKDIAKLLISKIGNMDMIKKWVENCEYSIGNVTT